MFPLTRGNPQQIYYWRFQLNYISFLVLYPRFLIFTLLPTTQILEYIQLLVIKSFFLPHSAKACFSSIIIRSHLFWSKSNSLILYVPLALLVLLTIVKFIQHYLFASLVSLIKHMGINV